MMPPIKLHKTLYGAEPGEAHVSFYDSGKMGYSDKEFDVARFEAVVVLTLHKTLRTGIAKPSRVVLLVAPTHEKWVMEQFDKAARRIYGNFKKLAGAQSRTELAKLFGNCFAAVFVGSRLLQLPEMPEAWTSFGFTKEDPIPDWMRDGLLSV